MTYRILPRDEWPRLLDIVGDKVDYLPHPDLAICAVAESDSGIIQGCLFMQMVPHMEPLVIKEPYVNFTRLVDAIEDHLADHKGMAYYAFSDTLKVNRMAEINGMERTPYTAVWRKEIK